jgi:hypothetical protein
MQSVVALQWRDKVFVETSLTRNLDCLNFPRLMTMPRNLHLELHREETPDHPSFLSLGLRPGSSHSRHIAPLLRGGRGRCRRLVCTIVTDDEVREGNCTCR